MIGHSLENDLAALKISHANVIDTAVVYPHPAGLPRKNSLRYLTYRHLKRYIQNGDTGHDSVEDAMACVELVKLKLVHGERYGMEAGMQPTESILRQLVKNGVRCAVVDSTERVAWFIPIPCAAGERKRGVGAGEVGGTSATGSVDVVAASNDERLVKRLVTLLQRKYDVQSDEEEGDENSGKDRPSDRYFIWGGLSGICPSDLPKTLHPVMEAASKHTVFMFFGYPDNASAREQDSDAMSEVDFKSVTKPLGVLALWVKP